MRIVDLHCYPGTPEWIRCQGPYVEALARYWKREWVGKPEDDRASTGVGGEVGAGFLLSAISATRFGYELFLEANALIVSAPSPMEGAPRANEVSFPVLLGIGVHFGK